jgi:hypothetical protein
VQLAVCAWGDTALLYRICCEIMEVLFDDGTEC